MTLAARALVAAFAVLILWGPGEPSAQQVKGAVKSGALLAVNKAYDQRTIIRPSIIPGAGNGLFAIAHIAKGETIGELGGRLITEAEYLSDSMKGNEYIASLDECAWNAARPYKYIDAKEHGAPASRINSAPREINGNATGFQNALIKRTCTLPYVVFVALEDIQPGQEIWASYGPSYDYDRFMYEPAVRDFFCGLIKIDCNTAYSFEH